MGHVPYGGATSLFTIMDGDNYGWRDIVHPMEARGLASRSRGGGIDSHLAVQRQRGAVITLVLLAHLCLGTVAFPVFASHAPAVSPTPSSESECSEASILFDYDSRTSVATLQFPPCRTVARAGSKHVRISGRLDRTSVGNGEEEAVRQKRCSVRKGCKVTVLLDHPNIEVATYSASFSFRSRDGKVVGSVRLEHDCASAELVYFCE